MPRSAMDCSSDESSDLSDTDIDDYAEQTYLNLKSGKLVARYGADRFRCPFCLGKKKQDYRYNELLQHAVGVGASNRAAKVKANHLALANLLKNDYSDAAGSLPSRQADALINPPKPVQDQELFVWPWMGILANVPAEQTQRDGAILMQHLAHFNPSHFDAVHSPDGYTGFAVVRFTSDWIGFKDALAFHNNYKSRHLGKMDLNEASRRGKYICGWLAKEEDYKADDPVGMFLSANGELKTVSELQLELSRKTETIIASLTTQISAKSKYMMELEIKCNKMNLALRRAMEDSDSLHQRYNEAMRKMQSAAREHSLKIFQETDQLRKQLDEKESDIQRRSKQLSEIVAQTDMERRKLKNERKKNAGQNDSLHMARVEQQKANEAVRVLVEKHKKEKEVALNKILQLEKQLDEKQKLELEIQQLRGQLEVVKHMEGEGVDVKKRTEELTEELENKIDDMEDLEALNQTLIIKERMTNDELQDAKKELISGLSDLLGPRSNIGIKRMGELDEKPFIQACKQKYGVEAETKGLELCSMWQDKLKDANWHPFKVVVTGEKTGQIINEHDEELAGLKQELGQEVYQAVTTALLEINEYNASGSYVVSELWNNKENKKASMGDVVQHILKQWKLQKRRR
ncbi:factor of DNA methylation 1 isoform X2 [Brachypodium distachyon]|uniref:Factor of DNA methylation 1-5/IDN2 domain-containing protein n=1 Tax=Brachypodium distachyon TaxID=15368 RepID=A0A0Q3JAT2_BRADI|nr:factor of DNA methylation 1 isoform X2 [Brachypodium distachyon]XP_010234410.1 factor of DNA methylation 1 isoform X2 [Brachypodium distachyon]XP_014755599.1 factor of DNA methylation 1 isoform X2 [Brachypodium distachyon]KQJ95400.1 hypothetical protein BRADI_3g16980v3 [Brachypodium distachyon]PNT66792.1 hypothetical protein BRADI_3g16980v3 [Brachypodium distachyon]|eukprot:XP_010234409.1 factor of DNA methylation 1 isoform X2 [Brachypodium distachyon]